MNAKSFILHRFLFSALGALSLIATSHANNMSEEAIASRIAPVGSVYLQGETPAIAAIDVPVAPRTAETVYNTFCVACHSTGIAGAPKVGDIAAWEERLGQGRDILNNHAINGFNAMPARGTCMDCADKEIITAIDYMLTL